MRTWKAAVMSRSIRLAVSLAVVGFVTQASAKDVCLKDQFNNSYVFRKVKTLRAGAAVPLTGFEVLLNLDVLPIEGTAMMRTDGTVIAGMTVHGQLTAQGVDALVRWFASDATLAGSGDYDLSPLDGPEGGYTFTSVDCATVAIP